MHLKWVETRIPLFDQVPVKLTRLMPVMEPPDYDNGQHSEVHSAVCLACMPSQWDEYEPEVRSGNADRVNAVIDELKYMDVMERAECFEECFDGVTDLYSKHDDGYVRQSCVRVVEQIAPKLPAAVNLQSDGVESPSAKTVYEQTDAVCGFLLDALTDDDGRVRQAAKRALKDTVRTYDALDERATVEGLIDELETMAAEASGKQRDHLLEAKEEAEFFLQSGIGRMIQGLQKEVDDTLDS